MSLHEVYELNALWLVAHVRILYLESIEWVSFIFIVEGLRLQLSRTFRFGFSGYSKASEPLQCAELSRAHVGDTCLVHH